MMCKAKLTESLDSWPVANSHASLCEGIMKYPRLGHTNYCYSTWIFLVRESEGCRMKMKKLPWHKPCIDSLAKPVIMLPSVSISGPTASQGCLMNMSVVQKCKR